MYYPKTRALIQPKLTIGQPNDKYEQEADRVADQVMRMPQSDQPVQRKCEKCEEELQMKSRDRSISTIQQKSIGENISMQGLQSSLQQSKGGGQPLDTTTNQLMSRGIGADFSNVKIHTDSNAIQMNQQLNAKAFTNGSDVYFNQNQYNPQSSEGKHLLAHELTHVVQQGGENSNIQRLSVTPTKTFTQGPCGESSAYWNFTSGVPAPETGGYIIQKVEMLKTLATCPDDVTSVSTTPVDTFWEAWWVAPGDTIQEKHKLGIVDYTDRSFWSASSGANKSGHEAAKGEIRFFGKDVTGDLGKEGELSSDPAIARVWRPGSQGGVSLTGWLPSTRTPPTWWSNSLDGPGYRWSNTYWNCCPENSSPWSESDAFPR